jgi:hypothetical protein
MSEVLCRRNLVTLITLEERDWRPRIDECDERFTVTLA